jgi:predicted nuclease of predicted toxin-antitoxin system
MIWVDAHLSPALAKWITAEFGEEAQSVRDVGLRHAKDQDIFAAARQADAIVMTKDEDFVEMVVRAERGCRPTHRHGLPRRGAVSLI